MITINNKTGRIDINLTAFSMGNDLCVLLTGGDVPHLGALTAASKEFTPQTIVFEGHKEQFVTEMASEILRNNYEGNFVICCGIHVDGITKQEISDVVDLCRDMIIELCERLKN